MFEKQRPRTSTVRLHAEPLEDRLVPSTGVGVLSDFAGLAFDLDLHVVPPDTSVAVGPAHVVEAVNVEVGFFDKTTGAKVFEQDLFSFFGPVGASGPFIADPKVSFDELSSRFVVTAFDRNFQARTSYLYLAVSDDSDPNGQWEMHRLDVSHNGDRQADFPQLGWDADAIYISTNMGTFQSGNVVVELTTIDKASLLDGDNATITYYTAQRKWPHQTMQPAVMHGAQPGDPMYFVEAIQSNPGNQLLVVKMTDKLSANPIFTEFKITVPKYNAPPDATQPGGEDLDTNWTWILSAAWRDGRLVAAHNAGTDGHKEARARWYEFDTTGVAPTLIQSGQVDPGAGVHTYYPSIEIAPNGDIGMTFMQSSATEFVSMYVAGRKRTDPPGTMQPPVLVKAGEATYRLFILDQELQGPQRAGDYSGISVDPVDGTFWAGNEYATAELGPPPPGFRVTGNWGTWIANFFVAGEASAAATHAPSAALGIVATQQIATLTIVGGAADDNVLVVGTGPGALEVFAFDVARNDFVSLGAFSGITNLTFDGNDGNDLISIHDLDVEGTLDLRGGNGHDIFVVRFVARSGAFSARAVNLDGGDGDDQFFVGDNVFGFTRWTIDAKLTVDGGAGSDSLFHDSVAFVQAVTIALGDGDDLIRAGNAAYHGKLSIDMGAGNDRIEHLQTGPSDSAYLKAVKIIFGDGDDVWWEENGSFESTLQADGGNGDDEFADLVSIFAKLAKLEGFETGTD